MSTTSPERTERERTEVVDGRFRPSERTRQTHHPTNRESALSDRPHNPLRNCALHATPAALATGVSVNHSATFSSWLGRLAPLMCQCTNHTRFWDVVVVRAIRLWDED